MPEQLLIDQDAISTSDELNEEIESELQFEKSSLASMADADFEDEDLSEEALMKLEIKGKVEQFIDENPVEAVRLMRILMQDEESKFI